MIKPFHVDIPIFCTSVVLCANCTAEEACAAIYRYKKKDTVLNPEETLSWVQTYEGDVYMWVRDVSRASTVFHELVHVAFAICRLRGMQPDEELIAYLVGWMKIHIADKLFEVNSRAV